MNIRKFVSAFVMGTAIVAMTGCNADGCVNKRMSDVGLKQGDNPLEKGVIKYDKLVDMDEACNRAWADYESNLQRRSDLIPQLVATVKGSSKHEEKTLTAVIQARADASSIKLNPQAGDFENAEKFAEYQAQQQKVHTALQQLQENYPNLQAVKGYHDLQVQIEGTENRLLRAREVFNKAVEAFNTELRHVSGKVINPVTGWEFKPRAYFSVTEEAKKAPTVNFEDKK